MTLFNRLRKVAALLADISQYRLQYLDYIIHSINVFICSLCF